MEKDCYLVMVCLFGPVVSMSTHTATPTAFFGARRVIRPKALEHVDGKTPKSGQDNTIVR